MVTWVAAVMRAGDPNTVVYQLYEKKQNHQLNYHMNNAQ